MLANKVFIFHLATTYFKKSSRKLTTSDFFTFFDNLLVTIYKSHNDDGHRYKLYFISTGTLVIAKNFSDKCVTMKFY